MSGTVRKKILVKPRRRTHREIMEECDYSVTSTLLNIPELGAVVIPWLVLRSDPAGVSKVFLKHQGEVTYDELVNIFMSLPDLRESPLGYLDEFSQSWVVQIETPRDLSDVIYRLTSFPTVVGAFIRSNSLMQKSVDIPLVVMLQPKAKCMESLVKRLQSVQHKGDAVEKFYFEVDLAASVKRWAAIVLKEDLTVRAGRFSVGSGAPYNHMFDWQNVFCCIPCLPCCLIASPVYRLQRALRYKQGLSEKQEPVVFVGSESTHPEDQAKAIRNLMAWAKAKQGPLGCKSCGMLARVCACKGHVMTNPPIIVQNAPVDTKETKEMQENWKSRQKALQSISSNRMQTLKDIRKFTARSWAEQDVISYGDEDAVSRDSESERGGATPSDVKPSITTASGTTIRSSGTFNIGDLGVFSLGTYSKVHPQDERKKEVSPPKTIYDPDW